MTLSTSAASQDLEYETLRVQTRQKLPILNSNDFETPARDICILEMLCLDQVCRTNSYIV